MDPFDHSDRADLSAALRLFDAAARRVMPAPERIARARRVAHAHWTQHLDRRRRRAWLRGLVASTAAAASLAGLFAWASSSLWLEAWRAPGTKANLVGVGVGVTGVEMASIARVVGGVRITDPRALARAPRVATASAAGTAGAARIGLGAAIETASDGRVAIAIGGLSIRLDVDTRVVLDALDAVRLERGAIYIDSGRGDQARGVRSSNAATSGPPMIGPPTIGSPMVGAVRIETPYGTVRHLGTQFDVRVDDGGLRTRVREGVVTVERSGTINKARAGEALRLVPGRLPAIEPIVTSGADWAWTASVAPPFQLEGAPLAAFLDWVSREEGWRWAYESEATRTRAARILLHGSMDRLSPSEAVAPVLAASGLRAMREGDRLIVSFAP